MKRRELIKCAALMVGGASATRLGWALTSDPVATLPEQFRHPPPSARPGVFWFWMGGMISREGITQDAEALAAQGIGRVLLMQMPEQCPYPRQWSYRDYPGKVKVLSDEWFDLVNFAVGECDRLGLEGATDKGNQEARRDQGRGGGTERI